MTYKDEGKQVGVGVAKVLIGAVPIIGPTINEAFFEIRGRIKQERYNKFVDSLVDYMNTHYEVNLSKEQIEKEEIGDFFESIVTEVIKTNVQKKVDALKRVLAGKIVNPNNFDYALVISELISELSEIELRILEKIVEDGGHYADYYSDVNSIRSRLEMYKNQESVRKSLGDEEGNWRTSHEDYKLSELIVEDEKRLHHAQERLKPLKVAYQASTYNLEAWEFHLHISRMVNKGIIQDEGGRYGVEASTIVSPNQVAYDIIEFLVDKK